MLEYSLVVFFTAISLLLSVYFFTFSVDRIFGKAFNQYINIVGGVICAPFIVFVAAGCCVLSLVGVRYPLFK